MVLRVDVVAAALDARLRRRARHRGSSRCRRRGGSSTSAWSRSSAAEEHVALLSARFEGFDERIVAAPAHGRDLDRPLRALRRRAGGDGARRRASRGCFPARSAAASHGASRASRPSSTAASSTRTTPGRPSSAAGTCRTSSSPATTRGSTNGAGPRAARGASRDGIRAAAPAIVHGAASRSRSASRTRTRSSPRRCDGVGRRPGDPEAQAEAEESRGGAARA